MVEPNSRPKKVPKMLVVSVVVVKNGNSGVRRAVRVELTLETRCDRSFAPVEGLALEKRAAGARDVEMRRSGPTAKTAGG